MYKILSVDDEPINQAIVEELFSTHFDVALASSGEECLTEIDNINPELILMDVSMPGIDGYQTCRDLKARETTQNIPIIFVSARSTLDDKIKGYEAGGHDYITKPFNHAELQIKIEQTIKSVQQSLIEVTNKNQHNDKTTQVTIRNPGDVDAIIQFVDESYHCHSPDELGELLLHTCQQLKLNSIIQFHSHTDVSNFSSVLEISPLEDSLFELTRNKERFFDFNNRTMVIYPHISLLVKNMPENDVVRYGEVKDLLSTLLNAAESKLNALLNEATLSTQYKQVLEIIKVNLTEFEQSSEGLPLEDKLKKIQNAIYKLSNE